MTSKRRPKREKPNQLKEQKVKSLEFLKPTLATTLAIVLAWLLSVRPAQAGYILKLQQVGPNVVATGSGAIDLTGLTFSHLASANAAINPRAGTVVTGPTSSRGIDFYSGAKGPFGSFGSSPSTSSASSGNGDMVGIVWFGFKTPLGGFFRRPEV